MKLGLFLFILILPTAHATEPSSTNFYQLFGLPPTALPAEIEAAYLREKNKNPSPQLNAQLEVARQVLTTPELKTQYDQGKRGNLEVTVPLNEREQLAALIRPVNPEKASLLARTGKISLFTLNNGLSFYLAMGASEAWSCYRKNDPNSCSAYLQSLKEPSGHVSLALFMGASHVASQGLIKMGGEKVPKRLANFMGLAAGSLVSEVFMEFYNHPQFDAYLRARYIEDPEEREQKKEEALQKLYEETFGDPEWSKHKLPVLAELIAASALSEATLHGYDKAIQSLNTKLQKNAAARSPDGTLNSCAKMVAAFASISSGQAGAKLTGYKKWMYNRGREGGGLLLFFAWAGMINHPIHETYNIATLYPDLKASRKDLLNSKDLDQTKLESLLEKNSKLWDKYRKNQLSKAEEIMVVHSQTMQQFENDLKKPYLFYSWLSNGGKEDDPIWEAIRDSYYNYRTQPTDANVLRDKNKFLQGFFCGPDPEKSFHDSLDYKGLPVPGKLSITVDAYRVSKEPGLCKIKGRGQNYNKADIELWKQKLKENDYQGAITEAYARLQITADGSRIKKLNLYESRVDKTIVSALEGQKTQSGLPIGVLPSFEEEIKDLQKMKEKLIGTPLALIVEAKIDEAYKKQEAANNLLTYMKAPLNERIPPEQDLEALLGLADTENSQEWQKAVRYFNGFVLQ